MKRILAGAVIAAGISGHAFAADFAPSTTATPVAAPPNWTGLYLGAHIGYGSANQSAQSNDLLQPGPGFIFDLGSGKFDGGLGGGQIGFLYQSGAVVLGAEGEFSWGDISGTSCSTAAFTATTGGTYTCNSKIQSVTTATGSLGATFDRALIYLKGGGAWVKEENHDLVNTFQTLSKNTRSGWTVGGGLEYALSGNWSARLEYDYIKLDDIHAGYIAPPQAVVNYHNDLQTNMHLVKLGLNYKLDWFGAH